MRLLRTSGTFRGCCANITRNGTVTWTVEKALQDPSEHREFQALVSAKCASISASTPASAPRCASAFCHHTISAISLSVGFGDLSYFNRTFRAIRRDAVRRARAGAARGGMVGRGRRSCRRAQCAPLIAPYASVVCSFQYCDPHAARGRCRSCSCRSSRCRRRWQRTSRYSTCGSRKPRPA